MMKRGAWMRAALMVALAGAADDCAIDDTTPQGGGEETDELQLRSQLERSPRGGVRGRGRVLLLRL